MINREDYLMIKQARDKGCYLEDIACQRGCSVSTVKRALQRQGPPPRRKSGVRQSKLDDFKSVIDALLAENVWNAEVIFAEIKGQGYAGGITILRDYIHPKRTLRESKATTRYETAPGHQLQHDWGELQIEVGGELRKVYVSVNVLGYSRRFYAFAAYSNDAEHTYESLIRAFEWFGGSSAQVLVDNQKAAVLEHPGNGQVKFNEGFLLLSRHYEFQPKACKPYRAQTKGKTERMVRYVKENFFQRYRSFESLEHLNQQLGDWLTNVADERHHDTLKEKVADRFAKEQPHLQKLPDIRYDTSYRETRRVPVDGYINFKTNRYSVPSTLVGQQVSIRMGLDRQLRVYGPDDTLVASHLLVDAKNRWVLDATHHRALYDEIKVETRDLSHYEEVV
ncbi:integrase [Endozoicomonas montiporae]|uniref:Integrase n=2 Tax=Endozoicomonas montiporae TaxID=1027273 RepID=A0A081N3N9_9GAMM|nr:IS21 family transposase [Endozoicomonas montiporae]AMO55540.1 IS21 family transposase, ORF1 [Endozoicomonas montiporae CL-33]AMO55593.1 IS21 family transposase, ORF1 [Endozoicomonas montiporae CL-33]AMO58293.1 IS21 family transposase, ORF1 [Endozoicomonas montiporae CL-33]AMO58791.1 IS21 family transposase, ORF1 [Endozoicomonas montiporae CL-33]KEQ11474.1 integrase [Endozoicomonas montiporae]